jgi:hypothetical protein
MTRWERIVKAAFAPLRLMPLRVRCLVVLTVMLSLFFMPLVAGLSRAFTYSSGGTVQEHYAEWFEALRVAARCLFTGKQQ